MLRRPVEPALRPGIGVVNEPGQVGDAGLLAGPDRVLEGVEHQVGGHLCRCPPPDNAAGEDVEDERDVDRAGPGRDVGEVSDPQLVGTRGPELPVDQVESHWV